MHFITYFYLFCYLLSLSVTYCYLFLLIFTYFLLIVTYCYSLLQIVLLILLLILYFVTYFNNYYLALLITDYDLGKTLDVYINLGWTSDDIRIYANITLAKAGHLVKTKFPVILRLFDQKWYFGLLPQPHFLHNIWTALLSHKCWAPTTIFVLFMLAS